MSNTDVWMPLHIGKYMGDTMHLNGAQHGAYLLLIMHYWINGPLEDDDEVLSTIARTERHIWDKKIGPVVRRFFTIGEDGLLHQRRCDSERERVQDISAKRRAAAHKSHRSRTNGSGSNSANAHANAHAKPEQETSTQPCKPPCKTRVTNLNQVGEERAVPSELTLIASPLPEIDIRQKLWKEGIPIIRALVGLPDQRARSLLGKLLKNAEDNCALVLEALQYAQDLRPMEPLAWLTKACRGRKADTPEQVAMDWKLKSHLTDPDWDNDASYFTGLTH